MAAPILQPLKGFRDFLPTEKRKREYVATKIKESFEHFGFDPLETPTLEYASSKPEDSRRQSYGLRLTHSPNTNQCPSHPSSAG